MRRTIVVAGVVVVVVVLAVPAVRRGVAARVADFRRDFAEREAELRDQLLPDPADITAAERRRAAPGADVEPY